MVIFEIIERNDNTHNRNGKKKVSEKKCGLTKPITIRKLYFKMNALELECNFNTYRC